MPAGPALLNFIKILSLFNTQPNRPRASPAIFKHVGQVPYSRGFKFGEKGPIKILAHFCLQAALLNFIKILSLFNTQPNRPRASPAIFKHVGQVPYSRGFKFGEKGPILPAGPALLNFIKILSLFNTQPNRPRASPVIFKHVGAGTLLKGLQIWGKGADQNFGPFLPAGPALLNFIKILSLFNTQPNRPRASPAIFKHVGQVPYSRGFKFGEKGPILPAGPALLNFIKILSLFNTQPNSPRASPAIFNHVGQVPYSRGFKFGEKGPIKILAHF